MSFNVLIIPEDFRKDQYILKPVIRAMLRHLDRPTARVRVCMDPLLTGISQAMDWRNLEKIIEIYPMVDVFLLLVDRDGKPGRRQALDAREQQARGRLNASQTLYGENAWQEIEIWALAGCGDLPPEWTWQDLRGEVQLKETYFEVYAEMRGLARGPGAGRRALGGRAGANYSRLRTLCPEDIQHLEARIANWLAG